MERRQHRLITALGRHGIRDAAALIVVTTGEELRVRTEQAGAECAVMFEVETGAMLGDVITGEAGRVTIMPHLRAMAAERRYIQVHTHPRSLTFSDQDVALFLDEPQIHAMVVLGGNGTWHLLSRRRALAALDPDAVLQHYADALIALGPRYRALVQSGAMRPALANREGRHQAMQSVARRYGLRYDRVETGGDVR